MKPIVKIKLTEDQELSLELLRQRIIELHKGAVIAQVIFNEDGVTLEATVVDFDTFTKVAEVLGTRPVAVNLPKGRNDE